MASKKKIILLAIFLAVVIVPTVIYYSQVIYHESRAMYYCKFHEDYKEEANDSIPLATYYFIKRQIIQENQIPSYIACCEELELDCIEAYEGNLTYGVLVNTSNGWRLLDMLYPEEDALFNFHKYEYQLNNGSWEYA